MLILYNFNIWFLTIQLTSFNIKYLHISDFLCTFALSIRKNDKTEIDKLNYKSIKSNRQYLRFGRNVLRPLRYRTSHRRRKNKGNGIYERMDGRFGEITTTKL